MKLFKLSVISVFMTICFGAAAVFGQSDGGTIRGTVSDPNEAVVNDAKVTATSLERGDTREVTTNENGIFVIPELKAGLYNLTVEASGFKRTSISNVKVDVQGTQSLSVKLEVGVVADNVVNVEAEAVTINADTPVRQTTVSERQVRELPLLTGGPRLHNRHRSLRDAFVYFSRQQRRIGINGRQQQYFKISRERRSGIGNGNSG